MKRAFVLVLLMALALPVAAQSYDRKPITLPGFVPDGWGQSLSAYQQRGAKHFPGERVHCVGVFMKGYRSDSSWIYGTTRWWDKAWCMSTQNGSWELGKDFILDAKRTRITIYNVNGP